MSWSEVISVKSADVDICRARFVSGASADVVVGRTRSFSMSTFIKALIVILLTGAVAVQADESSKGDTTKTAGAKVAPAKAAKARMKWLPFDSVRATFPKASKPLFLYISDVGCVHCEYMDSAVFNRPELIKFVQENLTPVRVDINNDVPIKVRDTVLNEAEFRKLLSIKGIPSYYFFDTTGRVISALDSQMDLLTFKRMLIYLRDSRYHQYTWDQFILLPAASDTAVTRLFKAK
jgi:thioredoxin-related protein